MSKSRIEETIRAINQFGKTDNGLTRLAYSEEDRQARDYFIDLCKKEKLNIIIDECGNIIARRESRYSTLPAVAFGSHLDTVISAGSYDGIVGVIGGLEVIRRLNEKKVETDHPIELIVFACEESSRFNVSTVGSKAMSGFLHEELAVLRDKNGVSLSEAFEDFGLDLNKVNDAYRKREEIKIFLELHIEQGPILEHQGKQIGIVLGIAAATRISIRIIGESSHSGATPMITRKDALLGASEIMIALEKIIKDEIQDETVATVGAIEVKPNAINVIPGEVELRVDIRGISSETKSYVVKRILEETNKITEKRNLNYYYTFLSKEEPTLIDKNIVSKIEEKCKNQGIPYTFLMSGAGHDAMNMGKRYPTGLIFIPSKNGLSHNAAEFSTIDDIEVGVNLLEELVLLWANSKVEV